MQAVPMWRRRNAADPGDTDTPTIGRHLDGLLYMRDDGGHVVLLPGHPAAPTIRRALAVAGIVATIAVVVVSGWPIWMRAAAAVMLFLSTAGMLYLWQPPLFFAGRWPDTDRMLTDLERWYTYRDTGWWQFRERRRLVDPADPCPASPRYGVDPFAGVPTAIRVPFLAALDTHEPGYVQARVALADPGLCDIVSILDGPVGQYTVIRDAAIRHPNGGEWVAVYIALADLP